jgi:glycogen phosphorylase
MARSMGRTDGHISAREEATARSAERADSEVALLYLTQVSASRPASDYTVRIIPYHANAPVPLEAREILWQR